MKPKVIVTDFSLAIISVGAKGIQQTKYKTILGKCFEIIIDNAF